MQLFNVTKNIAIELSNTQIAELREMSRTKAAAYLNIKESQARKIVEAIKSGELVEMVEVTTEFEYEGELEFVQLYPTTKNKRFLNLSVGTFIRANIEQLVGAKATVSEVFERIVNDKEARATIQGLIPDGKQFNTYVRAKIIDAMGREGYKRAGSGRNAVYFL